MDRNIANTGQQPEKKRGVNTLFTKLIDKIAKRIAVAMIEEMERRGY